MADDHRRGKGHTSANIDDVKAKNADGTDGVTPRSSACWASSTASGRRPGPQRRLAYNIVKQVGNYSESFERNVGEKTKLGLRAD